MTMQSASRNNREGAVRKPSGASRGRSSGALLAAAVLSAASLGAAFSSAALGPQGDYRPRLQRSTPTAPAARSEELRRPEMLVLHDSGRYIDLQRPLRPDEVARLAVYELPLRRPVGGAESEGHTAFGPRTYRDLGRPSRLGSSSD